MPKAPNENRTKAEQMFGEGMALVEIAERLGISEGTVRSWKSRYGWGKPNKDKKKSQKKTDATLQKTSATKNNGKGATLQKKKKDGRGRKKGKPGNPNPVLIPPKHGGYSRVYWDTLDDAEKEIIEDEFKDPELILIDQIKMYTVRERRIMIAINKYREKEAGGGLYVSQTTQHQTKRKFKNEYDEELYNSMIKEKIDRGDRLPGEQYNVTTQTQATIDLITRLEREMSYVQSSKTKAIEALSRLQLEKKKMEKESQSPTTVDDWIKAVLGEEEVEDDE